MPWPADQPFHALTLTGGGYRGLFTARVLQGIEDHTGEPIGRRFDITCGTSIGGIVAIAAAFEIEMRRVVKVFEEQGALIFPPHDRPATKLGKAFDFFRHRTRPRYDTAPLREAILQLVDKDATLGDAKHPVLIPAVNLTQGRPQVFKTRHNPEWVRDWRLRAVDVAIATAAAPTFFELAEVGGNLYADGGLFANSPDLIAIHEAEYFIGVPISAIRLLSVGTTTKSYSIAFSAGRSFGIGDWMDEDRLFSVTISSQQQFVGQLVAHRLDDRFVRLDHEPSAEQTRDLGLDVATEAARKTLIGLAEKTVTDALSGRLELFLRHAPQLTLVKED